MGVFDGVASGLLGLAGSIFQSRENARITREQNKFNAEQAQLSRDWQESMYNRFQSPQSMVKQYQDAGLNPALMYDSGSMPSPSFSGDAATAASYASTPNPVDSVVHMVSSLLQMKQVESNINLNSVQAGKLSAETVSQETQNTFLPELLKLQVSHTRSGIKLNEAQAAKITVDINHVNKSIELMDANIGKLIEETNNEKLKSNLILVQTALENAKIDLTKEQTTQLKFKNVVEEITANLSKQLGMPFTPENSYMFLYGALTNQESILDAIFDSFAGQASRRLKRSAVKLKDAAKRLKGFASRNQFFDLTY